jgi:hypothetical protein
MKMKAVHGSVFAAMTLLMVGCAAAVCPIVDLADKACPLVVSFVGEAGTKEQMMITHDDARELAARKAARKAAADHRDGGDDCDAAKMEKGK